MGREKSDDLIVPEDRRKAVQTAGADRRGGKGVTASEQAEQLELFVESVDSPKGDDADAGVGQPLPGSSAVLLSTNTGRRALPTMEEVVREGNLRRALKKVASNNGAPGIDKKDVRWVREHFGKILPELQKELLDGSYEPGFVRRVWIPKPGGGQRGLGIPNVIDRVVQQAVHQVFSPVFTPSFHPSSHGFIEGRSCHTAIQEAAGYVEEGMNIVVDLDMEKFFDRVNHQRLVSKIEKKVEDRRLIDLIWKMLKAKTVMPDGVVVTIDEGVPQGGPLSPLLSNIVLDELDWELARRGHHFVRYADDCNIYVGSERSGHRVKASITRFIERRLRLKVNARKSAVGRPEDRHFVGFRLRQDPFDGSVEVLLSKRSLDRIRAEVRQLTPRNWGRSIEDCTEKINEYLNGWIGFFWIVTEAEERTLKSLEAHIRRRLRAIKLKQWKRKLTTLNQLTKLGVRRRLAAKYVYNTGRRRIWALSCCIAVHKGLSNKYFEDLNLLSISRRRQVLWFEHSIVRTQLKLPFG